MTTSTKTQTTSTTSTSTPAKRAMDRVAAMAADLVRDYPGLHAGEYREVVGAKLGQLGKALRAAERRELVRSTWDGKNLRWVPASKVA